MKSPIIEPQNYPQNQNCKAGAQTQKITRSKRYIQGKQLGEHEVKRTKAGKQDRGWGGRNTNQTEAQQ